MTIVNALLIAQRIAGLIGELACPENGDFNGHGEVTIMDALLVAQLVPPRSPWGPASDSLAIWRCGLSEHEGEVEP